MSFTGDYNTLLQNLLIAQQTLAEVRKAQTDNYKDSSISKIERDTRDSAFSQQESEAQGEVDSLSSQLPSRG